MRQQSTVALPWPVYKIARGAHWACVILRSDTVTCKKCERGLVSCRVSFAVN